MKKRVKSLSLILLLVISLVLPTKARSNVITDGDLVLSFTGDIAECSLSVLTNDENSSIIAHLTLNYRETEDDEYRPVAIWQNRNGTGELFFYAEVSNRPDGIYQLVADISASGELGSDHLVMDVEYKKPR